MSLTTRQLIATNVQGGFGRIEGLKQQHPLGVDVSGAFGEPVATNRLLAECLEYPPRAGRQLEKAHPGGIGDGIGD